MCHPHGCCGCCWIATAADFMGDSCMLRRVKQPVGDTQDYTCAKMGITCAFHDSCTVSLSFRCRYDAIGT